MSVLTESKTEEKGHSSENIFALSDLIRIFDGVVTIFRLNRDI
jgi:hypothetical protein